MVKKTTVQRRKENQRRHQANLEHKRTRLPFGTRFVRWLAWLGARLARLPRLGRILIAAWVALALSVTLGLLLFTYLFPISNQDPGDISGTFTVVMFALVGIGAAFYWVGWRLIVGFGWADKPLEIGRPAALWVTLGLVVTLTLIVLAVLSYLVASSPA